jgi:hypothetical protein
LPVKQAGQDALAGAAHLQQLGNPGQAHRHFTPQPGGVSHLAPVTLALPMQILPRPTQLLLQQCLGISFYGTICAV